MPERNNEYVYQPPAKFTEELRQRINNAGFSDEFKQQIKSAQKEEGRKMFERLTKRNSNGDVASHVDPKKRHMLFVNRLAAYEDSGLTPEEVQKMALAQEEVLPCKVGDTVYVYNLDVCDWVMSPKVLTFVLCQSGWFVTLDMGSTDKHPDGEAWCMKLSDFGKTVFLTREEAEKALQEGLRC